MEDTGGLRSHLLEQRCVGATAPTQQDVLLVSVDQVK